jgi:hypothetical protein
VWVSDLDPVAYPLAAVYAAIHRYVLWYHLPGQRPADVTEGGTAHFLVVRLQFTMCRRRPKLASIKHVVSASTRVKPLCYPPRRIRISRAWARIETIKKNHDAPSAGIVRRLKRADGPLHQRHDRGRATPPRARLTAPGGR